MKTDDSYYHFSRPEVVNLIPPDAITILDVGCAAGGLGRALLAQNPQRKIYGIEMVEEVAEKAREHYVEVMSGSLEGRALPWPEKFFDAIICADVLEHLLEPGKALESFRKHLKPGGALVSSIPNIAHWSIIVQILKGSWYYDSAGILDRTHLRFFTRLSILSLFRNSGFSISHMGGTTTGSNPIDTPAFREGLESLGLSPDTAVGQGLIFQYLTVAHPFEAPETALYLATGETEERTRLALERLRACTTGNYSFMLVDNGRHPLTDELVGDLKVVDNRNGLPSSVLLPELARLSTAPLTGLLQADALPSKHWLERIAHTLCFTDGALPAGPVFNHGPISQRDSGAPPQLEIDGIDAYAERFFYSMNGAVIEAAELDPACIVGFTEPLRKIGPKGSWAELTAAIKGQGLKSVVAQDLFFWKYPIQNTREREEGNRALTLSGSGASPSHAPVPEAPPETELFDGPQIHLIFSPSLGEATREQVRSSLLSQLPPEAELFEATSDSLNSLELLPGQSLPKVLFVNAEVRFTRDWFPQLAAFIGTGRAASLVPVAPTELPRCEKESEFEIQRYARKLWRENRDTPPREESGTPLPCLLLFSLEGWRSIASVYEKQGPEAIAEIPRLVAPNTYIHRLSPV